MEYIISNYGCFYHDHLLFTILFFVARSTIFSRAICPDFIIIDFINNNFNRFVSVRSVTLVIRLNILHEIRFAIFK